jgi:TonB family protein
MSSNFRPTRSGDCLGLPLSCFTSTAKPPMVIAEASALTLRVFSFMSRYLAQHGLVMLGLVTTLVFCSCASVPMATEGNPMPEKQVATFIQPVTPSRAYDTPPKFLEGYAPFFPAEEAKTRHWGYAVVDFNVTADGTTSEIRPIIATAYSFAQEAMSAVQTWRFAPARKHGQPVVVRMRLPFTFRT